ncbi:MAG: four helix bundle protein [Balneolales bacterium]|nr:four helix bundle protein [Balneolales bacterium]
MNNLYRKSFSFAVRVVNCYKFLSDSKKEFVLSKQLLKSGTSIGANISEAYGGISDADFIFKLSIAYKECLETKYWLDLLRETEFLDSNISNSLYQDADEVAKILYTIITKTKLRDKNG